MFTGLIEQVGYISQLHSTAEGDLQLTVQAGDAFLDSVQLGDSIAVNGVCLTVTQLHAGLFTVDVSFHTLKMTLFAQMHKQQPVNLEKALTLSRPLGGHLVSGHVDGIAQIKSVRPSARSLSMELQIPDELLGFCATKGSICVDGISLTINQQSNNIAQLNIVPHSQQQTTLAQFTAGKQVHIEVDLMARYAQRLLQVQQQKTQNNKISSAFLAEHGFLK